MSKTTKIVDGYVRVDLRPLGDFGFGHIGGMRRTEAELTSDLQTLAAAAKRRLDKFEDERGDVNIIIHRQDVCEHCGAEWTEDSTDYNGGCCKSDLPIEDTEEAPAF